MSYFVNKKTGEIKEAVISKESPQSPTMISICGADPVPSKYLNSEGKYFELLEEAAAFSARRKALAKEREEEKRQHRFYVVRVTGEIREVDYINQLGGGTSPQVYFVGWQHDRVRGQLLKDLRADGAFFATQEEAEAYSAGLDIPNERRFKADGPQWVTIERRFKTRGPFIINKTGIKQVSDDVFTNGYKTFTREQAFSGAFRFTNTRHVFGVCLLEEAEALIEKLERRYKDGAYIEANGGAFTGEIRLPSSKKAIAADQVEAEWEHIVTSSGVRGKYFAGIDKSGVGDYMTGSDFYEEKRYTSTRKATRWVRLTVGDLPNGMQDAAINLLDGALAHA